jgi:hypothetical protein
MRIASRPFARAGTARSYFLMMLGVLVLGGVGTTGCEDKHIGRPCELGADAGTTGASGGSIAIVSSPVLACPSRICLLPQDVLGAASLGDGPTCTATCSSDDDCSEAETTSKGNSSDTHCKGHFYWGVATTSGPFCCQKFCICNDFIGEPGGGAQTPTACLSASAGGPNPKTCVNVQ